VAVRLRLRGTHSGKFLGIPATGRTIEYVSRQTDQID
jgi:predicted ester cyclase